MSTEDKLEHNPFIEKAKSREFTFPLSQNNTRVLLYTIMTEHLKREDPVQIFELSPLSTIIRKRIEAFNLPISFRDTGLLALEAIANGNPGRAIVCLIDCLHKFEGEEVTASKMCDLYPYGHYNEETFEDYVDNYLKTRKIKYSEIY